MGASSAPAATAGGHFSSSGGGGKEKRNDLEPINAPPHRSAAAAASDIWTGRQHGQTSWQPAPRIADEDVPRMYAPVPAAAAAAAAAAAPELADESSDGHVSPDGQSVEVTIAKLHAFSEQLLNDSAQAPADVTGPAPASVAFPR